MEIYSSYSGSLDLTNINQFGFSYIRVFCQCFYFGFLIIDITIDAIGTMLLLPFIIIDAQKKPKH